MKRSADASLLTTPDYRQFIEDLKARVTAARISAARAVNRDLILLYWDIGRGIVEKQQTLGWGDSVVEMVSADLRREFPPPMLSLTTADESGIIRVQALEVNSNGTRNCRTILH